jgi:hypothetical protein
VARSNGTPSSWRFDSAGGLKAIEAGPGVWLNAFPAAIATTASGLVEGGAAAAFFGAAFFGIVFFVAAFFFAALAMTNLTNDERVGKMRSALPAEIFPLPAA